MTIFAQVGNQTQINQNSFIPVGTLGIEEVTTGEISANNSPGFTTPVANSFLEIDTTSKNTLSFQLSGTWSVSSSGGLYVQASVDGTNWISLSSYASIFEVKINSYVYFIESGHTGIWQVDVAGFNKVRIVAIDTVWTGSVSITAITTPSSRVINPSVPGLPLSKFLTSAGDGTGTNNLIGNYSSVSTDFYYQPPLTNKFYVETVQIQLSDNASFNQTDYGAIAGGLTNGITLWLSKNGTETPLQSGFVIKHNNDWLATTPYSTLTTFAGSSQTLIIQFKLRQDYGVPLLLDGAQSDKFILRLNDNFSTLVAHRCIIRGQFI